MQAPAQLESALFARNGRKKGDEIFFRCPYPDRHSNGDAKPSARYHVKKQVWYCDACKQSGGWKSLCEALDIAWSRSSSDIAETYAYVDEKKRLLFEVVRKFPKAFRQRRPDGTGGWIWNLKGVRRVLYKLPEVLVAVEAGRRIYLVEGEKDADKLARLGLVATTCSGGAGKWKASYSESLKGARVAILPDNDEPGKRHARAVAASLAGTAIEVRIVELPGLGPGGDVSDWIDAQSKDDDAASLLDQLVEGAPPWQASAAPKNAPKNAPEDAIPPQAAEIRHQYRESEKGLIRLKPVQDGFVDVLLTNFKARIAAEVIHDDGVETETYFELEASLGRRRSSFRILASEFQGLGWVLEHLGPRAIVFAGYGAKDHARVAIQLLSDAVRERVVYTHIGWRQIAGQWCYLHGGGAIGEQGELADVEVDLSPQVEHFQLPPAPDREGLQRAVRESLALLDVAPRGVTMPLFASIWRAVLGQADFSIHLVGQTGEGKSELAALIQQHFGAAMDSRHLPGSWSSTGNALESQAFLSKDAILVIDDFAPEGGPADVARLQREASRVLRAQGNASGRARLKADGSLRSTRSPRGLILSTGEDVPSAHSIRARLLVLEIPVGGMQWNRLTECQRAASAGIYAEALAGFVCWMAPRFEDLRRRVEQRMVELRAQAHTAALGGHKRTPAVVADLAVGMEIFLDFAHDIRALPKDDTEELWALTWESLKEAADNQSDHQECADPVAKFLELLPSALASGQAHVVTMENRRPPAAELLWGWRRHALEDRPVGSDSWERRGPQIGWVSDDDLYLDPHAAYRAAQGMATTGGLGMSAQTLWRRLRERGLLASREERRQRNTVRVTIGGVRRNVIHMKASTLLPDRPSQQSQPSQEAHDAQISGAVSWAGSKHSTPYPSHESVPETSIYQQDGSAGTDGTPARGERSNV